MSRADFVSRQLSFNWSQAVSECPYLDIYYNILASNCGSCPTTTNHTTVTCTDVPINGSMCTFAVQTVICENIGNLSDLVNVVLNNIKGSYRPGPEETGCTEATVSICLPLTVLSLLCGTIFTVIAVIIVVKLRKRKRERPDPVATMKQELPDSEYEHKQGAVVINTRTNVAYDQINS